MNEISGNGASVLVLRLKLVCFNIGRKEVKFKHTLKCSSKDLSWLSVLSHFFTIETSEKAGQLLKKYILTIFQREKVFKATSNVTLNLFLSANLRFRKVRHDRVCTPLLNFTLNLKVSEDRKGYISYLTVTTHAAVARPYSFVTVHS